MSKAKSIRFGEFELDADAWLLTRNNKRIALQKKPFQILRALLSRPGEVITRAELAKELWPELHVSYDHCLNTAVNALRNALGETTRQHRFIETRPGLGYRFVGSTVGSIEDDGKRVANDASESDLALGYHYLHRSASESLTRARACFHAVLQSDGMQASGHVALAELESLTAVRGDVPTREAAGRALRHAHTAQSQDPTLREARVAVAVASALSNGMYEEGVSFCSAALEGSEQSIPARIWLAELLCLCGRAREAVKHLQILRRANPGSLLIRSNLSFALYLAGDYDLATEQAWVALSLDPTCAAAQYSLALAYQQLGQFQDAVTEFQNCADCSGSNSAALAGLCCALATIGQVTEALRIRGELAEMAKAGYSSRCWRALVELAFGERILAEQTLREAAAEGDCLLGFVRQDPRFKCVPTES